MPIEFFLSPMYHSTTKKKSVRVETIEIFPSPIHDSNIIARNENIFFSSPSEEYGLNFCQVPYVIANSYTVATNFVSMVFNYRLKNSQIEVLYTTVL